MLLNLIHVSKAREKGVSPVVVLGVVLYAQKTLGNSSSQLPLAALSRFFRLILLVLYSYL